MRAPVPPEVRHFGNHEAGFPPFCPSPHEHNRTPVTLTAPGKPERHYNLTPEQMRLLDELKKQELVCPGFAVTIHDMACFQNL